MSGATLAVAAIVAVVLLIALYLGKLGKLGRTQQRYAARFDSAGPVAVYQDLLARARSAVQALYDALVRVGIDLKIGLGRRGAALREAAVAMGLPAPPSLDSLQAVLNDGVRRLDTYISTYLVSPPCDTTGQGACGLLTLLTTSQSFTGARMCAVAQAAYDNFLDAIWIFPKVGDILYDLVREFKAQAHRQNKPLSPDAEVAVDDLSKSIDDYNNPRGLDDLANAMRRAMSALCAHYQ